MIDIKKEINDFKFICNTIGVIQNIKDELLVLNSSEEISHRDEKYINCLRNSLNDLKSSLFSKGLNEYSDLKAIKRRLDFAEYLVNEIKHEEEKLNAVMNSVSTNISFLYTSGIDANEVSFNLDDYSILFDTAIHSIKNSIISDLQRKISNLEYELAHYRIYE
jgi:hypothetical protein